MENKTSGLSETIVWLNDENKSNLLVKLNVSFQQPKNTNDTDLFQVYSGGNGKSYYTFSPKSSIIISITSIIDGNKASNSIMLSEYDLYELLGHINSRSENFTITKSFDGGFNGESKITHLKIEKVGNQRSITITSSTGNEISGFVSSEGLFQFIHSELKKTYSNFKPITKGLLLSYLLDNNKTHHSSESESPTGSKPRYNSQPEETYPNHQDDSDIPF